MAGKYRLIDIPLSNCVNSGLSQVYVLTQFLSVSLHRHIATAYRFDRFDNGFGGFRYTFVVADGVIVSVVSEPL